MDALENGKYFILEFCVDADPIVGDTELPDLPVIRARPFGVDPQLRNLATVLKFQRIADKVLE